MTVRLAVFDMAGTTVADDNAVATAFCKAFEKSGFHIRERDVNPLMGYKKPVAIQIMLEKLGADPDEQLVDDIHREFENEMIDYYMYSPDVKPLPGAEDVMLEFRKKGIRVALNTGFSKEIADRIMQRLQWIEKGLADDYIASDEVEEGRPGPHMIRRLMQRSGIEDPREVIKIGDTEVDINEGLNAGCRMVIGVTTGAFTREQLEPYGADYIIDSLSELPALIAEHD